MNKLLIQLFLILVAVYLLGQLNSCVHEPIRPTGNGPSDTTNNPVDTTVNDTSHIDTLIKTCDPDTVYFERDILPILVSNCAKSGCHDASSAQDGVILSSFDQVRNTADVRPKNKEGSDLYENITETDPDKVMPPPPNPALSTEQINLIGKWIDQGAQNLFCEDTLAGAGCDTTDVSYSNSIRPVLDTYCVGCHQGSSPSGGVSLNSFANVQAIASTGRLYGAVAHLPGYAPMPDGGGSLDECAVKQIKAWVAEGTPNN